MLHRRENCSAISTRWFCASVLLVLTFLRAGAADDLRLIDASRRHDLGRVRSLLDQRIDVNVKQPDGATALHWAVHWDDVEMADLMLRAGAQVNVANELGVTPLAMACDNGSSPMVERLLSAGAKVNDRSPRRPTALMLCARRGSVDAIRSLLARGADVNATEPLRGQTALMWAAANGHADVVKLLLAARADLRVRSRLTRLMVNRADPNDVNTAVIGEVSGGRSTAFLFAAARGSVECARLLLDAGAAVDDTAADGASALVIAVHSGHRALANWLLEKGADPNTAGAGYTALHAAVLRGDVELVRSLLARGARVDARIRHGTPTVRAGGGFVLPENLTGATPLLLAAKFLERDMLRLLVTQGANASLALDDGTTALMVAAGVLAQGPLFDRRGRIFVLNESDDVAALETVRLTLQLGNNVKAANAQGETALHGAAARGYRSVVSFLLERGARADAKNARGQTPSDVADARVKDLLEPKR